MSHFCKIFVPKCQMRSRTDETPNFPFKHKGDYSSSSVAVAPSPFVFTSREFEPSCLRLSFFLFSPVCVRVSSFFLFLAVFSYSFLFMFGLLPYFLLVYDIIKIKIHSSCDIEVFCRNSSLQAVCYTPIARITGCVSSSRI